ncbi:hypothetical protein ILUMI_08609 [Ignelater luminosus]|uniref:Farnesol dehydrogenase n=1 Tax=Ignelater luminosus TaxID=2038154 RepID=A0A8K0D5E1_IGNLU|nr:hypothetical protein ILUMI_08609 [Ignelater luminosus]
MVVSMNRWKGKVVVVTGASAGIGAAITEALVVSGLKVVGLARRKERVEALAKHLENEPGRLYAVKTDISNEEEVIGAFEWIKNNLGAISILINNAGIIRGTNLIDGDTKMWKETLDTNVLGLCVATREAIRSMKDNNIDGHIIHINSIAGHMVPPLPYFNVYPASKHAVTALTETLRQELNTFKSKIKITSISPGATESEISQASGAAVVSDVDEYIKSKQCMLKSEDVTDAVLYVLSTPSHVQIHELIMKPVGEIV